MTEEARNAELLEIWLVRQVREKKGNNLTVGTTRKMGPNPLRNSKKLEDVLELLVDLGRIRITQAQGTKKRYIEVAPAVIKEWS